MNPQIQSLYKLQKRDRKLTLLERRLRLIPTRIEELDGDLAKLETMLETERRKCEDTRTFQRTQQDQLIEEEEMLRNSRSRLGQVKNSRELNATQREIDTTRRMAAARGEEIQKLKDGVAEAEGRITSMSDTFAALQTQASAEKERLAGEEVQLQTRIAKLKHGRERLTVDIDAAILRNYDRIRGRLGGIAFVAARDGRCTACKMHVPHQVYVQLRKGDEVPACESCGRLLYWAGHFPKDDDKDRGPKPKASPPKRRPAEAATEPD